MGNLTVDRVGDAAPRVGGAVFHGARAAARLDADVSVVARCAEADRALCLPPLEALGVPVTWRAGCTTAAFAFHYEGEQRVMRVEAVGDPWLPADVEGWAAPALAGAEWVHAGALLRSDFPAATLAALGRDGRHVLLDGQGLVRRAQIGELIVDGDVDRSALACLRVLKLDEEEARVLAGGAEPDDLRRLGVPEVVLTLGSSGSLVVTREAAERVEARPVAEGVDPTGAGDAFSLAYVAARADGAGPVEAARAASEAVADLLDGP